MDASQKRRHKKANLAGKRIDSVVGTVNSPLGNPRNKSLPAILDIGLPTLQRLPLKGDVPLKCRTIAVVAAVLGNAPPFPGGARSSPGHLAWRDK